MVKIKNSKWANWNKEFKKKKVSETLELTYNLFLKGNSIPKIAELREMKLETIQGQILKLIAMSIISVDDVIGKENKETILEKVNDKSIKSLSIIKESLPEEFSYFQIKCVLADFNKSPDRIKK